MKHYGIGLLFAVFCAISAFAGEPVPRLRVGSSSGIFGPVGNWTYETFAEAKKAGIDAVEISASKLFLDKEMTDESRIEARCRQLKRDLKRAGIEIWSVHMPFGKEIDLSQTDEAIRRKSVELHRAPVAFLPYTLTADRAVPPELVSRALRTRRADRRLVRSAGSCFRT